MQWILRNQRGAHAQISFGGRIAEREFQEEMIRGLLEDGDVRRGPLGEGGGGFEGVGDVRAGAFGVADLEGAGGGAGG